MRLIDADAIIQKLENEIIMVDKLFDEDTALSRFRKKVIPKLVRNVIDYIKAQPTFNTEGNEDTK